MNNSPKDTAKYASYHQRFKTPEERFWERVDKSGECWEWTGAIHHTGYGVLDVSGKQVRAHRYSLEIHERPLIDDEYACHHCDNKSCVNPDHLYIGDNKQNQIDAAVRERYSRQKLTLADVLKIKKRAKRGDRNVDIATDFGVSPGLISNIKTGKKWAHVR